MFNKKNKFIISIFFFFLFSIIYTFFIDVPVYYSKSNFYINDIGNVEKEKEVFSLIKSNGYSKDAKILKNYLFSYQLYKAYIKEFPNEKKENFLLNLFYSEYSFKYYLKQVSFKYSEEGIIEISLISEKNNTSRKLSFLIKKLEDFLNEQSNIKNKIELNYLNLEKNKNIEDILNIQSKIFYLQKKYLLTNPSVDIEIFVNEMHTLQKKLLECKVKKEVIALNSGKENIEFQKQKNICTVLSKNIKQKRKEFFYNKENSINAQANEFLKLNNELKLKERVFEKTFLEIELKIFQLSKNSKKFSIIEKPYDSKSPLYSKLQIFLYSFLIFLFSFLIIDIINKIIRSHKV